MPWRGRIGGAHSQDHCRMKQIIQIKQFSIISLMPKRKHMFSPDRSVEKFAGRIHFLMKYLIGQKFGGQNFVRRKVLSAENFVRRKFLCAEYLSSFWLSLIRTFMLLLKFWKFLASLCHWHDDCIDNMVYFMIQRSLKSSLLLCIAIATGKACGFINIFRGGGVVTLV
jgi:hypothetical protein